MANEKIHTPSSESEKPQEKDDGCENVPPASLLGETCPTTPTANHTVKGKPRLSGLQSALTPILKYLNIGNKCSSLSPVSNGPSKTNAIVSLLAVEDNKDSYACSVQNEKLPEITLLDDTCNSTMNMTNTQCHSEPNSPNFFKEPKKPELCSNMTPFHWLEDEVLPEVTLLGDTCNATLNLTSHGSVLLDGEHGTNFCETSMPIKSPEKNDQLNKPNSSQTPEKSSLVSENEAPCLETTRDHTAQKRSSLGSSEIHAKTIKLEIGQSSAEKMSTSFRGNLTHSISSDCGVSGSMDEDVKKAQLQVTQDISMSGTLDGSKSSSENSMETINKMQPSITSDCGVSGSMEEDVKKAQLQVTQDISISGTLDGSKTSSENSMETINKMQPSISSDCGVSYGMGEDVKKAPLQVTQDISMSSTLDGSKTSYENSIETINKMQPSISSDCGVSYGMGEDVKKAPLQVTQDISMSDTLDGSKSSSENSVETINKTQPSISSGCGASGSMKEDVKKAQLQVTQDISMSGELDGSKPLSENSVETINKMQKVSEANPVNTTFSLSNASAQSNNDTCELEYEPAISAPGEKPSCISDNTSRINPKATVSLNNTFTTIQEKATSQASVLHKQTVDLSASSGSLPMPESQNANVSTKQITQQSSLVMNGNCSDSKSSQSSDTQNQTLEKNYLQKSIDGTTVMQAGATSSSFQSTFESKPNGTITFKEATTMSNKSQDTQARASPCPVKNEISPGPNLPAMSDENSQTSAVSDKPAKSQESTFSVNTATEENLGLSRGEVKESSNAHPLFSESIINHTTESHKANTLNLDSTLDLKMDPLVTSTPMSTNKSFNFTAEREEGKAAAAQKRLYREGPIKPAALLSSHVPLNIVCDRKTFLRQPATKLNMPSVKPPLLLSKFNPASLLPKRPDLVTGLPAATRQTEAPKTNADQTQQGTKKPVSYNLRSAASASALKPPVSGLCKGATCTASSGTQRTVQGLKPPQVKGSSVTPSASDKPAGGTNPPARTTLPTKRHPLTKIDALPAAKKKKMDNPLPSSKVETPAFSSDVTSKVKTLKPPTQSQKTLPTKHDFSVPLTSSDGATACESTSRVRTLRQPATGLKIPTSKPQCHVCANCISLEAQLKQKDEEIKHLKEELMRCKKEDTAFEGRKN